MTEPTVQDLQAIRARVEQVGRLSDGLVRFGVFRLGIDGMLAWIPGVGELYSAAAGGFIVYQGYKAGVPMKTLVTCAGLLLGRTTIGAVPLAGAVAADLFTAHRWSARLVLREIDRKLADLGQPARREGMFRRLWSGRRPSTAAAA